MKISLKNQTVERKNSDVCIITEHFLHDEHLDFVIAKINGRYPDERRAVNLETKELAYVQSGSGKIVVEGKEHSLNQGDVVVIEAGEKYYWEGDLEIIITCRPAWTKEQHQFVD